MLVQFKPERSDMSGLSSMPDDQSFKELSGKITCSNKYFNMRIL